MSRSPSDWDADRWISFAALIVAGCALFFTIREFRTAREHDRLSVRPWLNLDFAYDETGVGWRLATQGLGPARIEMFEVTVDGKPQTSWQAVSGALGLPPLTGNWKHANLGPLTLNPNQASSLFWVPSGTLADALLANNRRVQMRICYCSYYDECSLLSWNAGGVDTQSVPSCPRPSVVFNEPQGSPLGPTPPPPRPSPSPAIGQAPPPPPRGSPPPPPPQFTPVPPPKPH
jgi:hypothetical protein